MIQVLFKWVLRDKQLDNDDIVLLYKARGVLRGDEQVEYIDVDAEQLYAPVATHESIQFTTSISSSKPLLLECDDVVNSCLYGKMDKPIMMEQPKN